MPKMNVLGAAVLVVTLGGESFAQEATSGGTVTVKTEYGDIVFRDISVHRDKSPWFDATVDNQTKTVWHVVSFDVSYSCGLARSEYRIVLPTITPGVAAVSDRPVVVDPVSCANPSGINVRFRSGSSDRGDEDQRHAEIKKRQDLEDESEALRTVERSRAIEERARNPEITGYAVSPLLIKDEACARDYAKAISSGGLEGRKMLSELLQYGCIQNLNHIFQVYGGKPTTIIVGTKRLVIRNVALARDSDLDPVGRGELLDVDHWIYRGFIIEQDIVKLSDQQIGDLFDKVHPKK